MGQTSKITLQQLKEDIIKASLGELGYLLGRYGGPHNVLLREKIYEYEAAKHITDLVAMEIAKRQMDNMLTDSLLSE